MKTRNQFQRFYWRKLFRIAGTVFGIGFVVLVGGALYFKVPTRVCLYTLPLWGDKQSLPYAKAMLRSDDAQVRDAAACGLGSMGPTALPAVPDLLVALHDESPYVASMAAWALGNIDSQRPQKQVVDALVNALNEDRKDDVRKEVSHSAAYAFYLFGAKARSVAPHLRRKLKDKEVAHMAVQTLGEMGGPEARAAIPEMTAMLSSTHNGERCGAIEALSKLHPLPDESMAAIKKLTNDDNKLIRDIATKAVGKFPVKSVKSAGKAL